MDLDVRNEVDEKTGLTFRRTIIREGGTGVVQYLDDTGSVISEEYREDLPVLEVPEVGISTLDAQVELSWSERRAERKAVRDLERAVEKATRDQLVQDMAVARVADSALLQEISDRVAYVEKAVEWIEGRTAQVYDARQVDGEVQ